MGLEESKKELALKVSLFGAIATVDLVKSTLGPKGMDKLLQSVEKDGETVITNDGATVLKSIYVDNPVAKILIDVSKVQDEDVGDGTTSVVVFAGELLREAEKLLLEKHHSTTIISGFREACVVARRQLESIVLIRKNDPSTFRNDLINIAKTTLSSKIVALDISHFAVLAVDAVLRLRGSKDIDMIQIVKKTGGTLKDSFIDEGFILDKKIGIGQPNFLKNAIILVANTPMDCDKIKIHGAKVKSNALSTIADIEAAEKLKIKKKCERIISHGINCFINRQLIYDYPEHIFTREGIISIEHADFDGIERLARTLGCDIVSTFQNPKEVSLGRCKTIEEISIGSDSMIHFSGVEKGEACTIVLRGASSHILDEAERSLHDAVCVLVSVVQDFRVIYGAGFPEMQMARAVDANGRKNVGKRSAAIQSFAKSLRQIPAIILDNAGHDSSEILSVLRAAHEVSGCRMGFDVVRGEIGNVEQFGVIESYNVKLQILLSALEAAECILRIDYIFRNTPRKRSPK